MPITNYQWSINYSIKPRIWNTRVCPFLLTFTSKGAISEIFRKIDSRPITSEEKSDWKSIFVRQDRLSCGFIWIFGISRVPASAWEYPVHTLGISWQYSRIFRIGESELWNTEVETLDLLREVVLHFSFSIEFHLSPFSLRHAPSPSSFPAFVSCKATASKEFPGRKRLSTFLPPVSLPLCLEDEGTYISSVYFRSRPRLSSTRCTLITSLESRWEMVWFYLKPDFWTLGES